MWVSTSKQMIDPAYPEKDAQSLVGTTGPHSLAKEQKTQAELIFARQLYRRETKTVLLQYIE